MPNFLAIAGANLVLRCPDDTPNCSDILVREDVVDGITYRSLELELTQAERIAILEGGTLVVSQMGTSWVPVAVGVLTASKEQVNE